MVESELSRNWDIRRRIDGRSNKVYIVQDSSGDTFVVRVPKDGFANRMSKLGNAALSHLASVQAGLKIPKVIRQTDRYTVYSYLPGEPIGCWDSSKLPQATRHALLDSLARLLLPLWTRPSQSGTHRTYQEWLLDEVDTAFILSLDHPGWGDPLTFLFRRLHLAHVIPSIACSAQSIRHMDLNACNVIADQGTLSGVVDWDGAQTIPAPAAVNHPLFIADIPGWHNGVPQGMTFEQDRAYLEAAVRRLAGTGNAWVADLLETSHQRHFLELSLRNRSVNDEYILRIGNFDSDREFLEKELETVLVRNPDLRQNPKTLELQSRLNDLTQSTTSKTVT